MLILGDDNETTIYPFINLGIIAITCVAFIGQLAYPSGLEGLFCDYGFTPTKIIADPSLPQLATLVTSMFLHGGLAHIAGNMWFLFIFGDNIEEFFGHWNYLLFYLVCGITGALVTVMHQPGMSEPSIGASGAISGVLAAYLILHPNVKINTWWGDDSLLLAFRTYDIPAWVIIGFWFILQYVCLYLNVPGIGWVDHIAGFTAGLLLTLGYKTVHGAHERFQTPVFKPYVPGNSFRTEHSRSSFPMYETDSNYLTRQPLPKNLLRGAIVFTLIVATAGCAAFLGFDKLHKSTKIEAAHTISKPTATISGAQRRPIGQTLSAKSRADVHSTNRLSRHSTLCKVASHHHRQPVAKAKRRHSKQSHSANRNSIS